MRNAERMALVCLSLLWHLGCGVAIAGPFDWDVSYYFGVAQAIVAGHGPTSDAVWNLAWLPPSLAHPADLHWMPLPSRVLVPGLMVARGLGSDPWRAAQMTTALLGALHALLAVAWVERLSVSGEARRGLAWCAGVLAGSGLGYVGFFSVPDSMAAFGLAAGIAFFAVTGEGADGRRAWAGPAVAALASGAAALCRSEGALVGVCVAVGFLAQRRWWAATAGISGLVASLAWTVRNTLQVGEGAFALRERAFNAVRAEDWLVPHTLPPLGFGDRAALLGSHALDLVKTPFAAGALLLPLALFVVGVAWRDGRKAMLVAPALFAVLMPLTLYGLVPSLAIEGSVFRSGSALLSVAVATAVVGLAGVSARFHLLFFPGLYTVAQLVVVARIASTSTQFSAPFPDCAALDAAGVPAGAPIFSYDPLGTSARCQHPGVILGAATTPAELAALRDRYGMDWALTAPADYRSWTWREDTFSDPAWTRSPASPRVFTRRPDR